MQAAIVNVPQFEGHNLNPIHFQGQPVWLVGQIEKALGYSKKGLTTTLSRNWSDEFTEGIHYHAVDGGNLRHLKAVLAKLDDNLSSSLKHARHAVLLTQAGLDMVCIKTDKPIGKALRKWLVEEVMPSLRKTGTYSVKNDRPKERGGPDPKMLREQRLAARERRLAAKQRGQAINATLDHLKVLLPGQVTPKTEAAFRIKAAQMLSGEDLSNLLPVSIVQVSRAPAQIAKDLGVPTQAVAASIKRLKLKGGNHAEERQSFVEITKKEGDKVTTVQKPVSAWVYDPEAVRMITTDLKAHGKIEGGAA